MKLGIEEDIKPRHPHLEEFGEEEMSSLMQQHEERYGKDKLYQSD